MKLLRLHRRVYDDVDEALASVRAEFGARQVSVYERLIVDGRHALRVNPTIGQLHSELGPHVRVFRIGVGKSNAPHAYIYKILEDDVIYVARFVHLGGYLPAAL